jgi:hypothetical protein
MAGNVSAVTLGAMWVTFNSVDLGYTKGGVTVTYKTITQDIVVQGQVKSVAVIRKEVSVHCPMAQSFSGLLTPVLGTSLSKGDDLLSSAGTLVLTSLMNPSDTLTITNMFPICSTEVSFQFDRERVWPIEFRSVSGTFTIGFAS